jgi:hypothetical protein
MIFYYRDVQYLIPQHFVYYTWANPLKPREISIASNGKPKAIELSVSQYEKNDK